MGSNNRAHAHSQHFRKPTATQPTSPPLRAREPNQLGAGEGEKRAPAIGKAATHFNDSKVLLEVSEDLQGAMKGLAVAGLDEASMLQTRGW